MSGAILRAGRAGARRLIAYSHYLDHTRANALQSHRLLCKWTRGANTRRPAPARRRAQGKHRAIAAHVGTRDSGIRLGSFPSANHTWHTQAITAWRPTAPHLLFAARRFGFDTIIFSAVLFQLPGGWRRHQHARSFRLRAPRGSTYFGDPRMASLVARLFHQTLALAAPPFLRTAAMPSHALERA